MKLGYTMCPGRGDTDQLLARFAQVLQKQGLRACGVVQINSEQIDARPCDMDVLVLPDGPMIRISQSLGKDSSGCRLDANALEEAVGFVTVGLAQGADILIVNKFGKHEAEGRGFRTVIADAIEEDIPVLVGLNELNRPAFEQFCESHATFVPPQLENLIQWAGGKYE